MSDDLTKWWCGRFADIYALEEPSMSQDASIYRARPSDLRRHPEVRGLLSWERFHVGWVLAYYAAAEGLFGRSRLLAMLLVDPREAGYSLALRAPVVFALDGPRTSLHRNALPGGVATSAGSPHLCLYFTEDPAERRWKPTDGLVRLFDLARRHLAAEHAWRLTGVWPIDEAEHGHARPARSEPGLLLPPLREVA